MQTFAWKGCIYHNNPARYVTEKRTHLGSVMVYHMWFSIVTSIVLLCLNLVSVCAGLRVGSNLIGWALSQPTRMCV